MEQTDTVENPKKITNKKQFETLVKLMEDDPKLARGFSGFGSSKMEYGQKWKELGETLNNLGPPTRSGIGWLKVWNDMKIKLKKKIFLNKEIKTTEGGCNRIIQLSPLEESVKRLLSLNKIDEPSGDVFGVRNGSSQPESIDTSSQEQQIEEPREYGITRERTNNIIETSTSIRNIPKNEKLEMLQSQTKYLRYMEGHSKKRAKYIKKIYQIKKHKSEVYENYVQEKLMMLKEKSKHEIELMKLQKQEISSRLEKNKGGTENLNFDD